MSIEIQCMTEKLIVITIKLDYLKVPSKSTVPTYENTSYKDTTKLSALNVTGKFNNRANFCF